MRGWISRDQRFELERIDAEGRCVLRRVGVSADGGVARGAELLVGWEELSGLSGLLLRARSDETAAERAERLRLEDREDRARTGVPWTQAPTCRSPERISMRCPGCRWCS